ncbi:unnamed protein product [Rhizoctonia solani]|uniref:Cytochrome P450 n=1 Tax=Rhizoctonia solani TaxID=456999 RepID=A0A8H2WSS5_9AGAM|nr:unnamed protein product [Rhizoctonia solani]
MHSNFIYGKGFGYSFDGLEPTHGRIEYLAASHTVTRLLFKLWYLTPILPWLTKVGSAQFRRIVVDCIPFGPIRALRDAVDILNDVAVKVYCDKKKEMEGATLGADSQSSRDVMTSLLFYNNKVAPEEAMSEEEVISQVNAALARTIYTLAQYPTIQSELREEIRKAYDVYGRQLSYDQLNSLQFLDAVCRESLRLYAPGLFLIRIAREDRTIPLLYSVKSGSGKEELTHVSVRKGTYIYLSLDGANRDPRTWGEDADVFRPSRWLDSAPSNLQQLRMPGIYSSLGFKFSQLEMKLLLVTLVSSFKFELSDTPITWRLDSVPKPYLGLDKDRTATEPSMPMRIIPLSEAS